MGNTLRIWGTSVRKLFVPRLVVVGVVVELGALDGREVLEVERRVLVTHPSEDNRDRDRTIEIRKSAYEIRDNGIN